MSIESEFSLSQIRAKIENIKGQIDGALVRTALEDLLTAGDCYILLRGNQRGSAYLLSAATIRYTVGIGYEQVFYDGSTIRIPAEELLHLRLVKLAEPGAPSIPS